MQKEKMTEQEIIKAWKSNKYMAFGGMPIECQEWAREHDKEHVWFSPGLTGSPSCWAISCAEFTIYRLDPEYKPPAPKPCDSGWVEYDIVKEGLKIETDNGPLYRHWQNEGLPYDRGVRTLKDGRVLTKFGGWYWDGYGWSESAKPGASETPLKIRFWAERIKTS